MVEFGLYAVDWEPLTRALPQLAAHDDPREGWDAFLDHIDAGEVDIPDPEAKRHMDLVEVYESFAPDWRSPSRDPLEAFLNAMFWSWTLEGEQILDLPEDLAERFMMDVAWSPDTVQRFAALWRRVDPETARASFDAHLEESPWSFDGWAKAIQTYGTIVTEAASEGKGLLMVIFG